MVYYLCMWTYYALGIVHACFTGAMLVLVVPSYYMWVICAMLMCMSICAMHCACHPQ